MATGSKHLVLGTFKERPDAHHNPQLLFNLLLCNTTHFSKTQFKPSNFYSKEQVETAAE